MIALLLFSVFVDGAGYWYRIQNHYPLTGYAPDLPPHFGDALGVSEPLVAPEGRDRIVVELAGIPASRAQEVIGRTAKLVTTKWVPDPNSKGSIAPGYKPQLTALTGDMITSATAQTDQNGASWVVSITFNSQGADIFGKLTTEAVNACPGANADCPQRHIANWLDLTPDDIAHWDDPGYADQISLPIAKGGKLVTNPTIIEPILSGQAQISGSFDQNTAKDLATLLSAGALPASLDVISSTEVGASLGQDAIRKSFLAGLLGLLVVVIFMIAYYRLPGFLASVALIFYAGVVLAVFKVLPVTLTLAGMAGFVLSVGMAVDANVLIFERFKEEMRAGRTIGAAVDAAVRRAWPAVRDSNTSNRGVAHQLDRRHPQPARDRAALQLGPPDSGTRRRPWLRPSAGRPGRSPRRPRTPPRGRRGGWTSSAAATGSSASRC